MAQAYTVPGATLGSGSSSPPIPTHSAPTEDNSLQATTATTTNNCTQTRSFNINNLTPVSSSSPSQLSAMQNASMSYPGPQDFPNLLPAMDQHGRPYATPNGYGYQHTAQAQSKTQSPTHQGWQPSGPMYQAAPRSIGSPSWRGSLSSSADQFNSSSANSANYTLASPISSVSSASSVIAHANLSNNLMSSYSYCLQRPDGQYTRLIPADMLPALNEIPARQASARGMMLLPDLNSMPPQGVAIMNQPITIKNRIDRIVATSNGNPKKTKIYCDKWIHDGTCAFTQQGCKYKHEMPFDKATQHSLGLFHGFPKWWRDLQEELQERENDDKTGSRTKPFLQQDWRKGSGGSSSAPSPRGSQVAQAPIGAERDQQVSSRPHPSPPTSDAQSSRCIWGPIEPPQRAGLESGGLITPSTFKKWSNAEQASPNVPRARPTSLPPT
ncbi:hypothetical protein ACJZ2D_011708 [Fusarium nematophilum]